MGKIWTGTPPTLESTIQPILDKYGFNLQEYQQNKHLEVVAAAYQAGVNAIAKKQNYWNLNVEFLLTDKSPENAGAAAVNAFRESGDKSDAMNKGRAFTAELMTACEKLGAFYAPKSKIAEK